MPIPGFDDDIAHVLTHVGELVVYGTQKGYGLLDSPGLDVADEAGFRFRGYARVLVVREGQFTGLTQETDIIVGGVTFAIRDIGNAGADGLRRVVVTARSVVAPPAAVYRITLTPASLPLMVAGETQQLTATLYDVLDNVLTGRTVVWSSSDPSIATVAAGLVTAISLGTVTITATCEGKSASTVARVVLPLQYTLDVDFTDPMQRVNPRIFPPELLTSDVHRPRFGQTGESFARGAYRRSAAAFDMVAPVPTGTLGGASTIVGPFYQTLAIAAPAYDVAPGPIKALSFGGSFPKYHRITPANTWANFPSHAGAVVGLMTMYRHAEDQQDIHDAKISLIAGMKIENGADIGKKMWLETWTNNAGALGVLRNRQIVTFTDLNDVLTTIENTQGADEGETFFVYGFPDNDTDRPTSVLVAYPGPGGDRRATGSVDTDLSCGFFHDTLGATLEHETLEGWINSDAPSVSAGSLADSTRLIPDSAAWWSGSTRFQKTWSAPAGSYLTAATTGKQATRDAPTDLITDLINPVKRSIVAIYVSPDQFGYMPNGTGDLVAELRGVTSGEIVTVTMKRHPLDAAVAAFRFSDGGAVYYADLSINQANQGELYFVERIYKNWAADMTFTRCSKYCFVNDEQRNRGIPRLWMKQTRTAEVMNNGGYIALQDASAVISADTLFLWFRFTPLWNFGDFYALRKQFDNGSYVGVEMLQTGPGGGNDYNIATSVRDGPGGKVAVTFTVDRGDARGGDPVLPNPKSYGATLLLNPGDLRYFRAGQKIDLVLGAENWAVHSLGLGFDATNEITFYDNGSTFADNPVSFTQSGTDVWTIKGLYCFSDRDIGRQAFVGLARHGAGKVAPAATFRDSVAYELQKRWFARQQAA